MMFKKILIANRGEIACRIMKTARRLGIATVAVHSTADARASHVEMADEAVHIGPAPATQSYLVAERIIDACRRTGTQAVHPGYGFLSEQAGFAEALMREGIVFIGPNPAAMRAMGDKIESKKFASAAKLSIVPGHLGAIRHQAEAAAIAAGIGYPVMIKATAGGGGKGMRIVESPADMKESFELARAEAASSFGDDRLLIEKYIVDPRHIEIQVLGDKHGNIIHLAERECSIQRRNQKVIEEAPSPLLDAATRKAMGEQAVSLARAVSYDSAGTVEFVASQDKSFYFLEMNTRLQVEHPVTELVTGIDLVEEMVRIAAGEPLRIKQEEVTTSGWAIEARVYAEDPYRGFLPSTGRLKKYRPPLETIDPSGATVRIDGGVHEGGEISVHYDPLIAKLITHGADRATATEAMTRALDQFYIDGIRHNIPFLAAIMGSGKWRKGQLSTGFIDDEYPRGFKGVPISEELEARIVAVAAAVHFAEARRKGSISPQLSGRPALPRKVLVRLDDDWHPVEINPDTEGLWILSSRTKTHVVSAWTPGSNVWRGEINGKAIAMQLERAASGYRISHRGASINAQVYAEQQARLARVIRSKTPAQASRTLRCPMPGLVVSIHVAAGQEVRTGDTLAVIEAMKMQNVLRAERDGKVRRLLASAGDILAVDAVIMEFETIE
jgi:propionyl-CoA carboxylase alpha chain